MTSDDPKAYTAPWTVTQSMHRLAAPELVEHICGENNELEERIGSGRQP